MPPRPGGTHVANGEGRNGRGHGTEGAPGGKRRFWGKLAFGPLEARMAIAARITGADFIVFLKGEVYYAGVKIL